MPSYGGGKALIGKHIAAVINKYLQNKAPEGAAAMLPKESEGSATELIVPFCGLLGVSIHTTASTIHASDINSNLIRALQKLKEGWEPPEQPLSKQEYTALKKGNLQLSPEDTAFYSIACAYSGIPFAGYRIVSATQDYFNNCRSGLLRMAATFDRFTFKCISYTDIVLKPDQVVYCDPPYVNNNFKCKHFDDFDHTLFWNTMREWSKTNLIFISEYTAPDDFIVIWEKPVSSRFSGINRQKTEKLFIHNYYHNSIRL